MNRIARIFALLLLLAVPVISQVSGISPRAFGSRNWREDVATSADLPATGNIIGYVRFVRDIQAFVWWNGDSWDSLAGAVGPQGEQGIKGDKGDPGEPGIDGVNGIDGTDGATGAQGIPGVKGDTGNTGATGATGAAGANGAPGADGNPKDLYDEGTLLTRAPALNIIGASASCVYNSGTLRWDCTFTDANGGTLAQSYIRNGPLNGDSRINFTTGGGGIQFRTGDDLYYQTIKSGALFSATYDGLNRILILPDSPAISMGSQVSVSWGPGTLPGSSDTNITRASAGVVGIGNMFKFAVALAAPPYVCNAAGERTVYYDTSHALCICGVSTWINLTPTDGGSCS